MKIGIVTEPLVNNYGGVIQNYALQEVLRSLGHQPQTINYLPSLPFRKYILYLGKNLLLALDPSKRRRIKPYHHFIQINKAFEHFISEYICLSSPVSKYKASQIRKNGYDALIVGSDQVWRKEYNPFLEDMYLNFATECRIPKVAYAASFGMEKWNYSHEQTLKVRELINLFSKVSVRENSGKDLCREFLNCDAEVVLDPTLLINKEQYAALCEVVPTADKPYLAVYILDPTAEKIKGYEALAAMKSLDIKYVTVSNESECSVEEWLAMFRDAAYVVTDSYHGTVFSIIFEKQFLCFINEGRGADRFNTLFSKLGIDSCSKGIDYSHLKARLLQAQSESICFLKNSLL